MSRLDDFLECADPGFAAEYREFVATLPDGVRELADRFVIGDKFHANGLTHHLIGFGICDECGEPVVMASPIDPSRGRASRDFATMVYLEFHRSDLDSPLTKVVAEDCATGELRVLRDGATMN